MDAAVMPHLRRNVVRLQLHVLAYNLGNFMRTLAVPETAQPWSLTSLREKLIKIGAKVVSHGRYVTFQLAEVAVPRGMFADILSTGTGYISGSGMPWDNQNRARFSVGVRQPETSIALGSLQRRIAVAQAGQKRDSGRETAGIWRMSDYTPPMSARL
jgi:Transposase DDE domain group 1